MKATEARKNWSETIDGVIRHKPQLIKRNRDVVNLFSLEHMNGLLQQYTLTLSVYKEQDGTFTGSMDKLDIVSHATSKEALLQQALVDLIESSDEYMEHFDEYFNSSNRKDHFPYIYKVLLFQDDPNRILDFIERIKVE